MKDISAPKTIDDYIANQPVEIQLILHELRIAIKKAAPLAHEAIKYQMPTFVQTKNLVHFAACKNHIGLYPTPSPIIHFKEKLLDYTCTKGAIQFPLNKPMPYDLITEIVKFRVCEVGG